MFLLLLDSRLRGNDGVKYMSKWLKQCFSWLRHISGDDAYERYLVHQQLHHADAAVLDRRAFFIAEQQRKWTGVKRCC